MANHSFTLINSDTDAVMICKPDQSPFSKEEQKLILDEINQLLPKEIKFANDGIFKKVICLKTKNYIMVKEDGVIKIKGSALKSSTLEPISKALIKEIIDALLAEKYEDLPTIYSKYLDMSNNITDIRPWCTKKTLSPTTFNSDRKNEQDIVDAIKGKEYQSGDKVYLFVKTKEIGTGEFYKVGAKKGQEKKKTVRYWILAEDFNGEYDKETYQKKLQKITERFTPILPDKIFEKSS